MRLRIRKLNRYSILVIILVIFIFMEILVISPKTLERPDDEYSEFEKIQALANADKKDAVEQKMLGVHLVENSENEKGWELFATEANGASYTQWVLKKVRVQFFTQDNASFTVTGDVGEIDGDTKDMIVRGNVKTTSSNGYTFTTDSLKYRADTKSMTSSDAVYMKGPSDRRGTGFKLNGVGLLVDVTKNKMTILDQVEAFKVIDGKNFKLNSQTAEFSNKSQEALFSGNVKMKYGPSYVESPKAYFTYSQKTQNLQKILLNKNVKLFEENKKATCEELEIDLEEDKMTLRGQPKVVQGGDEIQGQEIVFFEGGKKMKINKAVLKGGLK